MWRNCLKNDAVGLNYLLCNSEFYAKRKGECAVRCEIGGIHNVRKADVSRCEGSCGGKCQKYSPDGASFSYDYEEANVDINCYPFCNGPGKGNYYKLLIQILIYLMG